MGCPACSQPVPEGARFCPSCGTPLDDGARARSRSPTRSGASSPCCSPTSSASRRSPNAAIPNRSSGSIDAAFALLVADVEAHGGVVDKVLGDAIVALFGAPIAHEDDADRAVRRGAGDAVDAARLPRGASRRRVADADRRQHRRGAWSAPSPAPTTRRWATWSTPPPGSSRWRRPARCWSATRHARCARRACASGRTRTSSIRGRDQEVRVWQAVGHDSALVARRWQSDVPFVGRDTELDVLSNLASISVGGRSAIVAVTGEPGIGKSRLVARGGDDDHGGAPRHVPAGGRVRAVRRVERVVAGGRWIAGHGSVSTATRRPTRLASASSRRLEPFDGVRAGLARVRSRRRGGDAPARSPVGARRARRRRRCATRCSAGSRSPCAGGPRKSPVVLWIDDLQWAAPLLLDLLESIARHLVDLPLLIITTYRRDEEGITDWPQSVDPALTLHLPLAPLSESEVVELVQHRRRAHAARAHRAVDLGARRWQPVVPHRARPAGGRVPRRSRRPRAARARCER